MRGELVGINSAIISRSGGNVGIGFAVPTTIASSIMRQLLDFGEVRRGLLGVSIQTIDREIAKALEIDVDSGALISMVEPGSAAEEAGLHVDDIIVEVNKEKITGAAELRNAIGLKGSGEKINIKYVRGSETRSTTATLRQQAQRSATPTSGIDIHPGLAGAEFAAASTNSSRGIEVTGVVPDSPAAQRGLQSGDIITAANRREVRKLDELAVIAAASSRLFLLVQRGDRAILLQIR
jgi:S1-C subfamily serine protease